MPRPSLGPRVQVNVRMEPELRTKIDAARGAMSRDEWITRACTIALRPAAAVLDPDLKQRDHTCRYVMLKATNYGAPRTDGTRRRYRTYACVCGQEQEKEIQ